jgi:NAD(P)-dependent dehydrogenase (short-subunit alcohol dehydrogenase family)
LTCSFDIDICVSFATGCSSGLGKSVAILFAKNGWNVIATLRRPEAETELTEHSNITLQKLDVTDLASIEEAVSQTLERTSVDVVINNAGYGQAGPLEATSDENIQRQLDTNLLGVIRVTKAFTPHFRERNTGVFITITSIGGYVTFPFNSLYHATKFALEGFSESLAFELARFNVLVKTVAPGGIKTEFSNRVGEFLAQHEAYNEDVTKVLAAFTDPSRKSQHSTAEEIAEVVFEAATDGKNQVSYIAGNDAKALHQARLQVGAEAFRANISTRFLGK